MPGFVGEYSSVESVSTAAELMTAGEAVAVDNDLVFAIWGDGASPRFKEQVAAVKGSEANKPFGLTIPNEKFLQYVDQGRLAPDIAGLFEDPERLTSLSGALLFWRLPGRKEIMNYLPNTVWSLDQQGLPIVQNWSPEGKANIFGLLEKASELGVEHFAATSLNTTKEPEITDADKASAFARVHDLAILTDTAAKHVMSGSYPVVAGSTEGLHIVRGRPRAIGSIIISRLLDGYPLKWQESDNIQPGYDCPELKGTRGAEARLALLSILGWAP